MLRTGLSVLAAGAIFAAGDAQAQPRIVSLGNNSVGTAISGAGNVVAGSSGTGAARWSISGSSVSLLPLEGSNAAVGMSSDGQFVIGAVPNTTGLGGLPTDALIAARWSEATGWVPLPLVSPDPSLGVTGPGASGGSIADARDISATGRFVVGQTYIAPDETYRFRAWYTDTQTGAAHVLPTSFDSDAGRYRDGRALAVSADGAVIVGGEDPASGGRPIVWRWNEGTFSYDMSYLPDGQDPEGNPILRTVDEFFINDAGTIIVGTSFEFDTNLGYPVGPFLARWTWNASTSSWTRELLGDALTTLPSWWTPPPDCDIPHQLFPTGMSDDGNTIVGFTMFSLCGSFERGGFIWTSTDGEIQDFYDYLVQQGTPGLADYAPADVGLPPRLGWPNAISPDGQSITGFGGPFSGFGPGWVVNLAGGVCVDPFITGGPDDVLLSRCTTFIMNAAAGGSGPLTFQWLKNDAPIFDGLTDHGSVVFGAATSQLRIESVSPADAGSYRCLVSGACGEPVSTDAATAMVDPNVTPVANDTCATAAAVGEGTFDFNPCGAFIDDPAGFTACAVSSSTDVWYVYTPTFTGDARIDTCGATFDTVLSVYDACAGNELACNDDRDTGPLNSCSYSGSRIGRFPVAQGLPVWIRVANLGYLFDFSSGQLSIGVAPPPAANDNCASATPAVVGDNEFSTDEATSDGAASCGFATFGRDVWFTFAAPQDGSLSLTTCGTQWDTVLSVYDTCFGSELACNNDTEGFDCYSQSTIDGFAVQANAT
jgi:hypothetical protein